VSFGLSVAGLENKPQSSNNHSVVTVYPNEIAGVDVGETFSISVFISDVESLYGFDMEFKWDPNIIEYVSHIVMAPVESYEGGVLHSPTLLLKDEVDSTSSTYWVACASMSPADPFDGNGVFFVMTFEVLSPLDEKPFELVAAKLSNDEGQPMGASEYQSPSLVMGDDVWEFIRKREKDPKADGWLKWWITQMRRKWGY